LLHAQPENATRNATAQPELLQVARPRECNAQLPSADVFSFTPPGDPANDDEALRERVAIMVEGNRWTEEQALQEARWQADRERCWRTFLRNAAHVLAAPEGERSALLTIYAAEASRRYGERTGADMAASFRGWINARAVH
jgi:hypothetical protein